MKQSKKLYFTEKQKRISRWYGRRIHKKYEESEKLLDRAARTGSHSKMGEAMLVHHDIEYARLYHLSGGK